MYTLDHVDRNAVFSELTAPNQDQDWREENVPHSLPTLGNANQLSQP